VRSAMPTPITPSDEMGECLDRGGDGSNEVGFSTCSLVKANNAGLPPLPER